MSAVTRSIPGAALALALLSAGAVAAGPSSAGTPAATAVETALAEELRAVLGEGVPAGARVSVVLGTPFAGPLGPVRELTHDPRTGTVRVLAESGGRLVELNGRADITVDVPVPARRLQPGEVIGEEDLTSIPMPLARIGAGVVTDPDALIGMAGRRQLAAGRLIQDRAVGAPIVVQRNKPVTLVYEDGPLRLAARGRALQDGGVGDLVRVMNAGSSVVLTGTITAAHTVLVAGPAAATP